MIAPASVVFQRFIPARAGNISTMYHISTPTSVHPRTCGEHYRYESLPEIDNGSSPHVRGTFSGLAESTHRSRFIPARAGNICRKNTYSCERPVHPRTCGEHGPQTEPAATYIGSSPHVRGTSMTAKAYQTGSRFIPARAGNISGSAGVPYRKSVHPRTCGEHIILDLLMSPHAGSSPHVRGTYPRSHKLRLIRWFIPARAGNIETQARRRQTRSVHPRTCGEHPE